MIYRCGAAGTAGEGAAGSPNPVTPWASVCVMHWAVEVLPRARSQSAMVVYTHFAPAEVCRQNGALPVCAAAIRARADTAMIAAATSVLMGGPPALARSRTDRPAGFPLVRVISHLG